MKDLTCVVSDFEMSSLDFLNEVINPARVAAGENPVENGKFLKKIEDEIEDLSVPKIFRHEKINNLRIPDQKYYDLSMDQMLLVGMRESKAVRRSVLAKLKELSLTAAPKQELNTSNAAMNAINSITQAALDAIKAIQQATIMQPAIEQHTEPVEDKTLLPGHTYTHHRDDEICFSEMEPYVSNPNLRKELIAIFKFEERKHDPGQKKVKGDIIKAKPYSVYKKADVLPVLKAVQRWKLNNGGEKLLGRGFSFKEELSATDYQGEKFDEAYARLQDLNDKYLKEKQAKKRAKKQAKQK